MPDSRTGFFVPMRYEAKFAPGQESPEPRSTPEGLGIPQAGAAGTPPKKAGEAGERLERLKHAKKTFRHYERHGEVPMYDQAIELSREALGRFKTYLDFRFRAAGELGGDTIIKLKNGETIIGDLMPEEEAESELERYVSLKHYGNVIHIPVHKIDSYQNPKDYKVTKPVKYTRKSRVFVSPSSDDADPLATAMTQTSDKSAMKPEGYTATRGRIIHRSGSNYLIMPITDVEGQQLIRQESLHSISRKTKSRGTEGTLVWTSNGEPVIVAANMSKTGEAAIGKGGENLSKEQVSDYRNKKYEELRKLSLLCLEYMATIASNGEVQRKKGVSKTDMLSAASKHLGTPLGGEDSDKPLGGLYEMTFDDISLDDNTFSIPGDKSEAKFHMGLDKDEEGKLYPGVPTGTSETLQQTLESYLDLRGNSETSRKLSDNKLWVPLGFQKDASGHKGLEKFDKYFDHKIIKELKEEGGYLDLYTPVHLRKPPQVKVGGGEGHEGTTAKNLRNKQKEPQYSDRTRWQQYVEATILSRPSDRKDVHEDAAGKQSNALKVLFNELSKQFEGVIGSGDIRRIVENLRLQDILEMSKGIKGIRSHAISIAPFDSFLDDMAPDIVRKTKSGYVTNDRDVINPFNPKIANQVAQDAGQIGYSQEDPDTHENKKYGISVNMPEGAIKPLLAYLKVRGDSSETDRLFWMSLDDDLNKEIDKDPERRNVKRKINKTIGRSVSTDEEKDSEVMLGNWNDRYEDSGHGLRHADEYIVLDYVHKKDFIPSPVKDRSRFTKATKAWEKNPENKPIEINDQSTWPEPVLDYIHDTGDDSDFRARQERYQDFLTAKKKEDEELKGVFTPKGEQARYKPGERTGIVPTEFGPQAKPGSVAYRLPSEVVKGKSVEGRSKGIEISQPLAQGEYDVHIEDIKTSLKDISDPTSKLSALQAEIDKAERLVDSPEDAYVVRPGVPIKDQKKWVTVNADEIQELAYDLDDLYSRAQEKIKSSESWTASIDLMSERQAETDRLRGYEEGDAESKVEEMIENGIKRATQVYMLGHAVKYYRDRDENGDRAREFIIKHYVSKHRSDYENRIDQESAKLGENPLTGEKRKSGLISLGVQDAQAHLNADNEAAKQEIQQWLNKELTALGIEGE
jgi:hypothetical protein